jgi:hypothetical protein
MALQNTGYVGPQALTDAAAGVFRQDRTGSGVVIQSGGRWQEANRLGQLWTASTAAAGVNVPIYTSTTQQFVLSNPSGSGVSLVIKSAIMGYISGTVVIGFAMIHGSNVTSATAPSGTAGLKFNNKTGATTGGAASCLGSTVTVVASTWFRPSFSTYLTTSGTTTVLLKEDIDGSIIVTPGGWISIAANAAAFGTHMLAFEYQEISSTLLA